MARALGIHTDFQSNFSEVSDYGVYCFLDCLFQSILSSRKRYHQHRISFGIIAQLPGVHTLFSPLGRLQSRITHTKPLFSADRCDRTCDDPSTGSKDLVSFFAVRRPCGRFSSRKSYIRYQRLGRVVPYSSIAATGHRIPYYGFVYLTHWQYLSFR